MLILGAAVPCTLCWPETISLQVSGTAHGAAPAAASGIAHAPAPVATPGTVHATAHVTAPPTVHAAAHAFVFN